MKATEASRANRCEVPSDPFSPDAIQSPVEADGIIRESAPLVWLPHYGMWGSARYETVKSILHDWERFSSAKRPFDHPDFPLPALLVTDDPPTHGPIRKLMNAVLSPKRVKDISQSFYPAAEEIIDAAMQAPSIDAVADLAAPFVLRAFGDAMGLRREGRECLIPFGTAVLNTFGPANALFYEVVAQAADALPWVDAQCQRANVTPGGLASLLYESEECSDELAGMLIRILLSAGVDTSISIITNLLYALTQFPDQWLLLKQNPKLLGGAFEETHRWYSPSRMFGRVAHVDTMIGDTNIKAGEGVLLFVAATGRDQRIWDEPDRFDITRPSGKHISFGFGIHNCVGQMFARAEVSAFMSVFLDRVQALEPDGAPTVLRSNTIQSFSALPIGVR